MGHSQLAIFLAAAIVPLLLLSSQSNSPLVLISGGVALVVVGVASGMPLWRKSSKYTIVSITAAAAVAGLVLAVAIQ